MLDKMSRVRFYTRGTVMNEEELLKHVGSKDMMKYDLEMNKVVDFLKEHNA